MVGGEQIPTIFVNLQGTRQYTLYSHGYDNEYFALFS